MTATFGPSWTRALLDGCERLSLPGYPVHPEWVLAACALESAGTWDPFVLQGRARIVESNGPGDTRAEVAGMRGKRLSHGNGARGLFQKMPRREMRAGLPPRVTLYPVTDPVQQLKDAVEFWAAYRRTGFRHRAALYCANLAPARLFLKYDDDTIIYSANPEDEQLNELGGGWSRTYWPRAYRDNARPFGLDPSDPNGRIRMRDLGTGLDAAVRASRARYDAELDAVTRLASSRRPSPVPGSVWAQAPELHGKAPDLRDPVRSEVRWPYDDEDPDDVA